MKNLFLLRHSYAENTALDDFNRKLTSEGVEKANIVGKILSNYDIDIIFSSDSIRTKETIEHLLPYLKHAPEIEYENSLYNSNAAKLLNFIDDELLIDRNILLVNHNPAISQLAMLINKKDNHELQQGLDPASLVLFRDKKLISFWR
jgi:phosphohistidine phosphatase